MFGQEDFNAEVHDENHRTLNYISEHIDEWEHEGCVFLRLTDNSGRGGEMVDETASKLRLPRLLGRGRGHAGGNERNSKNHAKNAQKSV